MPTVGSRNPPSSRVQFRRSLVSGRSEATKTALGVFTADCFWALASVLGLTAVIIAEGALCDLSNPKTLLVFTSVIPQFLPVDGGSPLQAALLGVTFASIGFAALIVYAFAFSRIGLAGLQSRVGDALLRLSGAVLVLFGVRLAFEPAD